MRAVVLDTGPLGILVNPRPTPATVLGHQWLGELIAAGVGIVVPEIVDYEIRRELLRAQRPKSIALLDDFNAAVVYLPLTTSVMRRAAELWAQARSLGQQTAGDNTIDADMILIAQAMSLNLAKTTIATTNVEHLNRFFPAETWKEIKP